MKYRPFEQFFSQVAIEPSTERSGAREKVSKKEIDIFCRELLDQNLELKEEILKQMRFLKERGLPLPSIHITLRAIRDENGAEMDTGFVRNIQKSGFRKRDANVSAFIKRDKITQLAQPDYFEAHPEKFIKSLILFLQRYIHHGFRTNKNILGDAGEKGKGVPVMIIIDGNVKLEHGSDYDDHYILKNGASTNEIIGVIDLDEHNRHDSKDDIAYIADEILKKTASFYDRVKRQNYENPPANAGSVVLGQLTF